MTTSFIHIGLFYSFVQFEVTDLQFPPLLPFIFGCGPARSLSFFSLVTLNSQLYVAVSVLQSRSGGGQWGSVVHAGHQGSDQRLGQRPAGHVLWREEEAGHTSCSGLWKGRERYHTVCIQTHAGFTACWHRDAWHCLLRSPLASLKCLHCYAYMYFLCLSVLFWMAF